MSGDEHEPPDASDLNAEDVAEIGQLVRDLCRHQTPPDLVPGVLQALNLTEEGSVTTTLQNTQDDSPPPDLVEGVFKQLALSEHLQDFGQALRRAGDSEQISSVDSKVIRTVAPDSETLRLSAVLRESLTDSELPEVEQGVLDVLGLNDASEEVRTLLREVVCDQSTPDLVAGVMSQLGLEEDVRLGDLLGPDSSPDLWTGIQSEIAAPNEAVRIPRRQDDAPVLSFQEERQSRTNWLASGAVWAAAAAALLFAFWDTEQPSTPMAVPGGEVALTVTDGDQLEVAQVQRKVDEADSGLTENGSDLNELAFGSSEEVSSDDWELEPTDVVIENVDSDGGAFVQVLQFEEDAPPIIFITELDDGQLEDTEGATL